MSGAEQAGVRVLVVTGAGASRRLHVETEPPLPLMPDWARYLTDALGTGMATLTGLRADMAGPEFEEHLGSLMQWVENVDEMGRFAEMCSGSTSGADGYVTNFRQGLHNAAANAARFSEALHASLFDQFGPERIDSVRAAEFIEALTVTVAGGLKVEPEGVALSFATTNYDRSLEIGLAELGLGSRCGFDATPGFRTPLLDPTGLGDFDQHRPAVMYLHGAVGWYSLDAGGITQRHADQGYNPSLGTPAVLYPALGKDVARFETVHLWEQFEIALAGASHVLVLGHSLHDEHLVNLLRQSPANVAVSVYWPADRNSRGLAADAEFKRIRDLMPEATLVGVDSGPELYVHPESWEEWLADD